MKNAPLERFIVLNRGCGNDMAITCDIDNRVAFISENSLLAILCQPHNRCAQYRSIMESDWEKDQTVSYLIKALIQMPAKYAGKPTLYSLFEELWVELNRGNSAG